VLHVLPAAACTVAALQEVTLVSPLGHATPGAEAMHVQAPSVRAQHVHAGGGHTLPPVLMADEHVHPSAS
jgi:hypothetical protein